MKLKFETSTRCLLAGAVALGLIAVATGAASAEETTTQASADSTESAEVTQTADTNPQPALRAGRVVHVDPTTGRKTLPSAAQRAAAQAHLRSMLNRSSAGLIETASPSSGVMVNLQGRFRHANVLTVSQSGEVSSECSAIPPVEAVAVSEETDHE